jgi:hypothetical protein
VNEFMPMTSHVLDHFDSLAPAGVRFLAARNPLVYGIVCKGGCGEFVSVTVRLAGSEPLLLDRRALDRVAALTRVPKTLLAELPDELIRQTLNAQLRKRWSWFAHAVVHQNRILDFMAPGWQSLALKPSDVATTCAQALGDQACLAGQPEGEWPQLRFLFTTAELSHVFADSPRTNDRHHFFVGVQVDLCGWQLPLVHAVSYRLVCTNGMMALAGHPGSQRKFMAQTRTAFLEMLRAASVEAVGYIRSVLIPRIQESITRSADLEPLVHFLPQRVADLVRRAYRAEDLRGSAYHLVNALTRAANYAECPPDWRERLMSLAGELTVGRRCPACFRSSERRASAAPGPHGGTPLVQFEEAG